MIPDAERIVGDYLRTHPAVDALDARVSGTTPNTTSKPWVRVIQLDDRAVGGHHADHLIEFMLDLHCYAGKAAMDAHQGQAEASLLSRTVREALRTMNEAEHDGAVVTGVNFLSAPRLPDPDFEPARERYVRSVIVWAHAG